LPLEKTLFEFFFAPLRLCVKTDLPVSEMHYPSLVIIASVQISICNFCKKGLEADKDFSKTNF